MFASGAKLKISLMLLLSQSLVIGVIYHNYLWTSYLAKGYFKKGVDFEGDSRLIGHNHTVRANGTEYKASIAIGMGFTTRNVSMKNIMAIPLFKSLMPSFCKTASSGYSYRFFLAYDYDDEHMSNESFVNNFKQTFMLYTKEKCPRSSEYSMHLIVCRHSGRPAWAQNDAMIEAYLAGLDYFYRINDDTVMKSKNWTERFIDTLEHLTPSRIGVVGPTHSGGNVGILTYDFTHRTHVEIHGFHYPREFTDWYADNWITQCYKPGRSIKLRDIRLYHTREFGRRYEKRKVGGNINRILGKGRENLKRYISVKEEGFIEPSPKKVIAISLYNASSVHSWGVVRNAQLMQVIYPGWTLYVYTSQRLVGEGPQYLAVERSYISDRVINTLESLGAKIIYVDDLDEEKVPPHAWSYLVADETEVDVFLIRSAEQRLSEREFAVVKHWLAALQQETVLCIKDHNKYSNRTFIDGLWGAKSKEFRALLGNISMHEFVIMHSNQFNNSQLNVVTHLENVLYEKVQNNIVYYDSISCDRARSRPFPVKRKEPLYVGQAFDAHEQVVVNDKINILRSKNNKCDGVS